MPEKYIRQRKNGKWEVRMPEGVRQDGTIYRPSRYFDTRAQARAYVRQATGNETKKITDMTVKEWAEICVNEKSGQDTTQRDRVARNRMLIFPYPIARLTLSSVKREDIERWKASLRRRDGKPYSPSSLRDAILHLRWLLRKAERAGMISPITFTGLYVKQRKQVRREKVLQPEEAKALLDASVGSRYHWMLIVEIYTGLRKSELLGLKWEDIDFATGDVVIRHKVTIKADEWKPVLADALKTQNAYRMLRMPADALDALRKQMVQNKEERLRAGILWSEKGMVFPTVTGGIQNPNQVAWYMRCLSLRTLGRTIGIHSMRHLFATMLIRSRVDDISIAQAMGHSSANFTREKYAEFYDDSRKKVADAVSVAVVEHGILQ